MQSGFASKQFASAVLAAGLLLLAGHAKAADLSLPVTGNLIGTIVDSARTPQMGASVQLFNKYDRLVAQTLSTPDGRFAFQGLAADFYSIRVSLVSFLPAFRDKILVRAGSDSLLQIHLATLFSDIQVTSTVPTAAMTNDWKWVLRASPATRPVNRFLPELSSSGEPSPHVFSGTHAMVAVSGGDGGGLVDADSAATDMGTLFALSTNLFGKNMLQVAGCFGQNSDFGPSAFGFGATYSRNPAYSLANTPEITLTMSQMNLFGSQSPSGGPSAGVNQLAGAASLLRTMSISVYEIADPLDNLHVEYGITGESVDYLQNSSRVSPFARVTASLGSVGSIIAAYSDGGRPDELTAHQKSGGSEEYASAGEDLTAAVDTLARMPQVSNRNGRLELQRTQNFEVGFDKTEGRLTYAFSAFYEKVSNGRLNLAGDLSAIDPSDLLADPSSKTSTYNIGSYGRNGYLASINQRMTDFLDFTVAYGRLGGFTANQNTPSEPEDGQLNFLKASNHNLASVSTVARVPKAGTQVSASYGWADTESVIPRHVFTTQTTYVSPGLNIYIRQPLPSFGMPGHFELTGDMWNMLAQGYIPVNTAGGRQLLVIQAPKIIRGGLKFTF